MAHKIPKTLGGCADRLYQLRAERQVLTRKARVIEDEEKAIKAHLIDTLPKSQAEGVVGKSARAQVVTRVIAQVRDWDKFYRYVLRTKDFSLMARKPNEAAIKERWENKQKVPGASPFQAVKVSVTKK